MQGFPILTAIIVTPIIGSLVTLCTPARRPELARAVGFVTTAASLTFRAHCARAGRRGRVGSCGKASPTPCTPQILGVPGRGETLRIMRHVSSYCQTRQRITPARRV